MKNILVTIPFRLLSIKHRLSRCERQNKRKNVKVFYMYCKTKKCRNDFQVQSYEKSGRELCDTCQFPLLNKKITFPGDITRSAIINKATFDPRDAKRTPVYYVSCANLKCPKHVRLSEFNSGNFFCRGCFVKERSLFGFVVLSDALWRYRKRIAGARRMNGGKGKIQWYLKCSSDGCTRTIIWDTEKNVRARKCHSCANKKTKESIEDHAWRQFCRISKKRGENAAWYNQLSEKVFTRTRRITECFYCNKNLTEENLKRTGFKVNIDRLDSQIPYRRGNVVSCCWECNSIKGYMMSPKETLIIVCLRKGKYPEADLLMENKYPWPLDARYKALSLTWEKILNVAGIMKRVRNSGTIVVPQLPGNRPCVDADLLPEKTSANLKRKRPKQRRQS